MGNQNGYLLMEIVISLFVITLILVPFLGLLVNGVAYYTSAGETTVLVNLAQAQMELILDSPFQGLVSTGGFQTCAHNHDYEYVTHITFHGQDNLKEITVEVRARNNPDKKIRIVTLRAKE